MFTKHSRIILTTLVAAAAMTAPAYAFTKVSVSTDETTGVCTVTNASTTTKNDMIYLTDEMNNDSVSSFVFNLNGGFFSASAATTGSSGTPTQKITKDVEIQNLTLNNGYSSSYAEFAGAVTGSGNISITAAPGQDLLFTGNMTSYSGNISYTGAAWLGSTTQNLGASSDSAGILQFGGSATYSAAGTAYDSSVAATDGIVKNISGTGAIDTAGILRYNYTGGGTDGAASLGIDNSSITARYLEFMGGATYIVSSALTGANTMAAANNTLAVSAGTATFSNTVSNFGNLVVGSGATATFTGTLNLAGTLAASGSIVFSNGGRVALTGSLPDYTTSASSYVDADGNASSDGNGYVGSGTLTVFNGGTLSGDSVSVSFENQNYTLNTSDGTISLSNIYSTYFVNSGTASVSSASHADTSSIVVAQGAKLLVENTTVGSKVVSGSGTVELNVSDASGQEFTTANVLTGGISVEKTGVNKATISAAQSYTGGTKVSAGNLGVGNNSALGTGAVELSGGQLTAQANLTLANALTIGENGGTIHTNMSDLTLSGAVSGTGTLTKTGAETLVLSNNSLSLSNVSVSEGTLQVWNGTAAIGGSKTLSSVALASGTELSQFSSGAIPTAATTVGALTLGGNATVSETNFGGSWKIEKLSLGADVDSATLTLNANHSAYNFALFELGNSTVSDSGNFSGTIALTQTSTGTARGTGVILSNENIAKNAVVSVTTSPLGGTTRDADVKPVLLVGINASNVNIAGLQGGTAYTYLFSGTVASGTTQTVTSNSTTGTTAFQSHWVTDGDAARTLTIDTAASMSYDYAGTILANVNLVKDGAGTQTLSGASAAFDGTVEVKAGVLALGNAEAIGTGTSVTIDGGRLQVASGVTLNQTAITIALGDAYSSDAAIFGGDSTSTLATGTTFTLTADEDVLSAIASYTSVSYQILDTNTIVLAGALSADDFTLSSALSNAGWTVSDYSNGLVTLSIPEPSAFGLLAGVGALALVASRRRRRAK